jgi:membrane-bound ClpP family serine protease
MIYTDKLIDSIITDLNDNLNKLKNPRKNIKNKKEYLHIKNWVESDIREILNHAHFKLHTLEK